MAIDFYEGITAAFWARESFGGRIDKNLLAITAMGFIVGGVICLVVAVISFFINRYQTAKYQSIMLANPAKAGELLRMSQEIGDAVGKGNWRDYVKVTGQIRCDRPLQSEFRREPCVYFSSQVIREYEEWVTRTDSEGRTTQELQKRSETLSSITRSTPFQIADETGAITVNPDGAALDTITILDEFKMGMPLGGLLTYGSFSLAIGSNLAGTLGYRYQESILPIDRQAFILAAVNDRSGQPILEKPTASKYKFVISLKSEDQVAEGTKQAAQIALYCLWGFGGLGCVLIILGLVLR